MTVRRGAIVAAVAVTAGFAVLHLAGGRAQVGLLSGTLPAGRLDLALGLLYVLGWFGVVLAAPVVVLAVLLEAGCGRIAGRLRRGRDPGRR